jgi:hypothetical protein
MSAAAISPTEACLGAPVSTNVENAERVHAYILANPHEKVTLLREKTVVQWIFGDLSFLPPITSKNKTADTAVRKELEDAWGRDILKGRRPDLKLDKQWTNRFGEYIVKEIQYVLGKSPKEPIIIQHLKPDLETETHIIEVKTQTFYTTGTAGEKVMGAPFKYAEVPTLYGKPLHIVCLGGIEAFGRTDYGFFPGPKCTPEKRRHLDNWKESRIEFLAATDLLLSLLPPRHTSDS